MKPHPLLPHYFRQIESLRSAESALLQFIAWLHRCVPGPVLVAALADMESCCSGRLDCLQSLAHRHGMPDPVSRCGRTGDFLETGMTEIEQAKGAGLRQALAISICVELDRQLINGYRITRALAGRLRFASDARRLDVLMSILADRNICWKPVSTRRGDAPGHLEPVSG